MHNIESYSVYLHQVVKEGKYENALINFRENSRNFSKEEIAENRYLINDLLKCFREQNDPSGGLVFIEEYCVDVFKLGDSFIIGQLGWLYYQYFKGAETFSEKSDVVLLRTIDFLSKISFLEEKNHLLIVQLLKKIIGYEKRLKPISVDNLLSLFKVINIKHDQVKKIIGSDAYVVSGIMDIFRKSGHVERALGFLNFLGVSINDKTPEAIINSFGWCLYNRLKNECINEDDNELDVPFDSLLVELEEARPDLPISFPDKHPTSDTLNLISNYILLFSIDGIYSPFSKLFNLSLKTEKQKSNTNWDWMLNFLAPFEEKSLSNSCESIEFMKAGKPKVVELASDYESWHAYYSLALLKKQKFEQCIEISKRALLSIEKFHYNNDLWFARKIALSNKGLGNIPQAIKELKIIERKKNEWFIQKELAELYFENNEIDQAKFFGCKGALGYGEKEKKDGLFFQLGQVFQGIGASDLAYKHFLLVKLIRDEQGWSIPQKLKAVLEESDFVGKKYENSNLLYKELLITWRQCINESPCAPQKGAGEIVKVNSLKQIGTISGENNTQFFFHFNDFKDDKNAIRVGLHVVFQIKPPKEEGPGKNQVAYNIKIDNI